MLILFNGRLVEKSDKVAKILIAKGMAVQAERPENMSKKSQTKPSSEKSGEAKTKKKK